MARFNRYSFLLIAVVFHSIYMYSIFDIYFVSPIVHGMRALSVDRPPGQAAPAQRLVLIVGDGLRADKAFQQFPDPSPPPGTPLEESSRPRHLAPFLREKVFEGTFGVSHTRVPTESRPGHVALIAGLYEDVSAVMTGWKLNPVNFDSVFNQSRHTWSWGSPDILPMFKEGAVDGRVDAYTYGAEAEDFSQDATHLDTWVFDRVLAFFEEAKTNKELAKQLRQDKLVFFLHLLGLDTTGHSYRPYSREYLHNIKIVDEGVRKVTKAIDAFYDDGKTAYVFTADHGMSDWGSHGDGHPDNTRTPLITWGSGVAKSVMTNKGVAKGHEDGFSSDWNLSNIQRNDVSQADVAALMSYLVGLAFPVNSVGELPLAYLDAEPSEKANAALANARGILEQYHVKEEDKRATEIRYRGYPALGGGDRAAENRVEEIHHLIRNESHEEAVMKSHELLQLGLEGMRYLQTYDWLFLRAVVTLGYLGWTAYALATVIDRHVLHSSTKSERSTHAILIFSSILVLGFAMLLVKKSPITYYAYLVFPVAFWEEVWAKRRAIVQGGKILLKDVQGYSDYGILFAQVMGGLALLQALARGYHDREIFSICFVLACSWPAYHGKAFAKRNLGVVLLWIVSCVIMSFFTFLPAIKTEDTNLIIIGGALVAVVGLLYMIYEAEITAIPEGEGLAKTKAAVDQENIYQSQLIIGMQIGLVVLAAFVTRSSALSLQAKHGLPVGNQIVGWMTLVFSLLLPLLHIFFPRPHYITRLMIIFLTLAPTFIILTISYETLFYFTFSINLFAWIEMEAAVYRFQAAVARGKAMMAGVDPAAAKEAARLSLARKKANGPAANGHQNGHVQSQAAPSETLILSPKELLDKLAESTAALSISAPAPTNLTSAAQSTLNPLTLSHLRTSLFFLTLLQSAFFSTGNMATVSSFSLDSVYRLIPIFDPFSQGALLILKLMIPFALLSAALGVLNGILGLGRGALVGVAMGVSEVMTLVFFWSVRDEGSWLEIGTGISHFVIAGLMGLFCAGLEGLGGLVVGGLDVRAEMREEEVPVEELLGEQLEDGKDSSFREEIQRGVEKMMGEVGSSEGREMTN